MTSPSKCKLIVIDGLDFPDYQSDGSAAVRMYLGGKLGDSPDDVNAYAASSFYAVDRVVSYLNEWGRDYKTYDYIIADRYVTSNVIHQMAKLKEEERDDYIAWLYDYEYRRLEIPEPDLVIFLDVDPDISQQLMRERYQGDDSKKDIHESNVAYLLS